MADAVHLTIARAGVSQLEKELAEAAVEELRGASFAINARHGAVALINALITVWLDLNLSLFGADLTEKALRELRRDLPKIAATHRAMNEEPKGKPDA